MHTRESEYNRHIYLSTDFDRYRPGQALRLSFSSVSDFGFGIQKTAFLVSDPEGNNPLTEIELMTRETSDCLPIKDRAASHSIDLTLPQDIREGRYRVRLDFCQRPFEQMPSKIVSNEIEIISTGK